MNYHPYRTPARKIENFITSYQNYYLPIFMEAITFYDFNLDASGKNKWKLIFDAHLNILSNVRQQLKNILDQFGIATSIVKPLYKMTNEDNIMFYDEICYIADRMNMDPYEILLLQLVYETSSACTTAIIDINGKEFFFRTMDWPMKFLKNITIGLNLIKNGKNIGKVTTWLGYTGYLTATNLINNYTICINYRRTQQISISALMKNVYRTFMQSWPIGYLVRYIIENNLSISDIEFQLSKAQIISPCYITIYIPNSKSIIITRDCDKAINIRTSDLIQTNCDYDKTEPNILWSVERVAAIKEAQKILSNEKKLSTKDILNILLKHPILNMDTIYVHYQYNNEFVSMI